MGVNVSVSVAELLPGFGSVVPAGGVTVAVLTRVPVALADILQVTVKITEPPKGIFTDALILPEPEAGPVAPPAYTAVQLAEVIKAAKLSVTVAPVALLGPLLLTVMV